MERGFNPILLWEGYEIVNFLEATIWIKTNWLCNNWVCPTVKASGDIFFPLIKSGSYKYIISCFNLENIKDIYIKFAYFRTYSFLTQQFRILPYLNMKICIQSLRWSKVAGIRQKSLPQM